VITLSPGLVQGCFELLSIAHSSRLEFTQIRSAFSYFGSISSDKVLETVQTLQWLHADQDGVTELTSAGSRILSLIGYEAQLRQALLDYIDIARPAWIQNARFGRSRVIAFAGSEIGQIFVEAGLSHSTDQEVIEFWDLIAGRARGQENDRFLAIGRRGERLTMDYEYERTGMTPKWIAIEDNSDGYDILSIVGAGDPRSLSIEVKTSVMGYTGSFHLTRNEWIRSEEVETHSFYLWNLAQSDPELAIISSEEMRVHIPENQGLGNWESVEIPFLAFRMKFNVEEKNANQ
jgi:hypothetical protein